MFCPPFLEGGAIVSIIEIAYSGFSDVSQI